MIARPVILFARRDYNNSENHSETFDSSPMQRVLRTPSNTFTFSLSETVLSFTTQTLQQFGMGTRLCEFSGIVCILGNCVHSRIMHALRFPPAATAPREQTFQYLSEIEDSKQIYATGESGNLVVGSHRIKKNPLSKNITLQSL
jgi:hypothetical protein